MYSWVDDAGYMVNGDEDAYYTQKEKDKQDELAEKQAEAETFAFSSIHGEWIEYDSMLIVEISPHGNNTMALYDNPSFGRQVIVELEDDNTMKFDKFKKIRATKKI